MRFSVSTAFALAFVVLAGTLCAVSCLPAPEQIQDGPNPLLEETAFGDNAMPAEEVPSAGVRQARAPTFFPSVNVYPSYPSYYPYGYYGGNRIVIHKRIGYGYGGYGYPHYYY
ncbi:uncharacterized protein LOC135942869 [Cloeon dipterum]|uniref:uncharacterized protein LOC135942869 n=1 Tax=Cloeon dipterum TaxID=197152 RepID=UPI0032204638